MQDNADYDNAAGASMQFWDNPKYKPQNKICADFWDEFMRTAFILRYLYHNTKPIRSKYQTEAGFQYAQKRWLAREPSVYLVMDRLRKELHGEQDYSEATLQRIDAEIEREFARERNESRSRVIPI